MARLALQLEARELAHHADSARKGFVPGWHVVSVACCRLQGCLLAGMPALRQEGADHGADNQAYTVR